MTQSLRFDIYNINIYELTDELRVILLNFSKNLPKWIGLASCTTSVELIIEG